MVSAGNARRVSTEVTNNERSTMEEKDNIRSAYSNPQTARLILKDVWSYDKKLFLMMALQILFSVLSTTGGTLLPGIIIFLLTSVQTPEQFLWRVAGIFLVYGLIQAIHAYVMQVEIFQLIEFRQQYGWERLIRCSNRCDYEVYARESTTTLASKAENSLDANMWGYEGFLHGIVPLCAALLGLAVYALVITTVSPLILLLLLTLSVLSYLLYLIMHKRALRYRDLMMKERKHQRYYEKLCFDTTLAKDIRLYQSHPLLKRLFATVTARVRGMETKRRNRILAYEVVVELTSCIRDAVCYGYLIYLMRTQSLPLASFVLYLSVVSGFSAWFTLITETLAKLNDDLSRTSYLYDYIDLLQPPAGSATLPKEQPDIVFDHVSYCYPDAEEPVIKDFSLHIKPGETLALVGVNGAGKTTLVKLLAGLYHPTGGTIYVNGVDLETVSREEWFQRIGIVFQDAGALSFTIAENVSALPEGSYDEQKVLDALSRAGLKEKTDSLEKGIRTFLGKDVAEDGIQLSGGERQKMLLARAFYHDPGLLILDEPTAALDAISEQELYLQYRKFIAEKSSIFISHRLASTRFCDRIILMEDGRIAEEGNHDSLMEKKGAYYEMFEAQSRYYREGEQANEEDLF